MTPKAIRSDHFQKSEKSTLCDLLHHKMAQSLCLLRRNIALKQILVNATISSKATNGRSYLSLPDV